MTAGARVTDGVAVAPTFEWAGNSAGVLLRKGDSGVRRVVAGVSRRGGGGGKEPCGGGVRQGGPRRAGCLPSGRIRRALTRPGSGPASPRKRWGGRLVCFDRLASREG